MGFFDDLGTFGKDLFTGRWTGGETNVVQDVKNDPWVLAAPAAAIAAPFAIGALGAGAAGAGALEAGAGIAGEAGAVEAGGAGLFGTGATAPELTGAFGEVAAAEDPFAAFASAGGGETAAGGGAVTGMTPTAGVGNLEAPFSAGSWPTAASTGAASGGGEGSFLGSLGKDIMAHPLQSLGVGAAGLGLASALMRGNPIGPNEQNVQGQANTLRGQTQELMATGKQLESYLLSGTLPPGQQAQVNQAVKAARANAIANAAKNGQNTNPSQNTVLNQTLMDIDMNGLMLASKLEQALFDKGTAMTNQALDATKLSTQMYQWLTAQDKDTQKQVTQALGVFAGALAGGRGGVNLNLGGTRAA